MANTVFVNGRSISCKSGSAVVPVSFPDVCLSPPSPPAGPIPIPYPVSSKSADTTGGSTTVSIAGKPVMLRDASRYKSCMGDEAATQGLGKGLINHALGGAVFFITWSMDVLIEGENAVRHLDMTTSNHASPPNAAVPAPNLESMAVIGGGGGPDQPRCTLRSYEEGCDDKKTPHHAVPDHCMRDKGKGGAYYPGAVEHKEGLCVCVEGSVKNSPASNPKSRKKEVGADLAEHGRIHVDFDKAENALGDAGKPPGTAPLGKLEDAAAKVIAEVTGCDEKNLKKQMRDFHKRKGLDENYRCRADAFGSKGNPPRNLMGNTIKKTSSSTTRPA